MKESPVADVSHTAAPSTGADETSLRQAREADALVAAAKRGEAKAFDALYKRYRDRIYALSLQLTGSRSDADDITQDAFVQAYKHLPNFEGRSEFFTWLYRITLHRALNVKRSRARKRTEPLDDPRVTVAVAVDAGGNPQRALELQQTYSLLLQAFDNLSPILRTTVALTLLQGLSYPETAIVLDTSEGTVAWRVHEARRLIREFVHDMTYGTREQAERDAERPSRMPSRRTPIPVFSELATNQLGEEGRLELAIRLLAPQY